MVAALQGVEIPDPSERRDIANKDLEWLLDGTGRQPRSNCALRNKRIQLQPIDKKYCQLYVI